MTHPFLDDQDQGMSYDVEVAPGIFQSKEDYEANMAQDAMKDNEVY